MSDCPHPGFIRNMCIRCGTMIYDDGAGGVRFGYIHNDLRLAYGEVSRLRTADFRALLRTKKLYLVLDLDHTLLNSTRLDDIGPEEDYLCTRTDSTLFRLDTIRMMTKLRPFVREFLQEASKMFEMYIYTMGERGYALEMAKLLDPEGVYFDSRVISKDDCTQRHQKGLDVVLGQESGVLILDDTESVWEKHKDSLILMERYQFFSYSCRQFGLGHARKSLSELRTDENERDGALAIVLGVLRRVHGRFFDHGICDDDDDYAARDVRKVLKETRKEVLRGCEIVFSRVFPTDAVPHEHPMWKMAEQLGATCSTELGGSVTHVVSPDSGTQKSRWAIREEGKFLVHPTWVEAARYLWKRQPEDKFPANLTSNCPTKN